MSPARSIDSTRLLKSDCFDETTQNRKNEGSLSKSVTSGTSFLMILVARPSRIAVFPTPAGPSNTGFDLVRRDRTKE